MQVVLFLDLPCDLPVNPEFNDEWITFARRSMGVGFSDAQRLLQITHSSSRAFRLFIYVILEVARQALDLFDLLRQVAPQSCKLYNNIFFQRFRLVTLVDRLLMIVAENVCGIANATFTKKPGWNADIVDRIRERNERLRTRLVRFLDVAEVCDQIFENLPPSWP